jgi:general secretion pathway protein J
MVEHRLQGRNASRGSRTRGFTLIELLVAISILAIVAVLGWRGLDGIVRARIALTANLDQTRAMQLTFAQMQSDCAQVIPADLIKQHPPLVADASRLMMVRYVHGEDQPTRLQVVTYRVRDGLLTRRESTPTRDLGELDVAWQAAASDGDLADALVLQADVTAITMRLWQEGASWRSPPPPGEVAAAGAVITGLEVALQLRGRSTSMLKVFLLGAA